MHLLFRFLRFGIFLTLGFVSLGAVTALGAYLYLAPGLPPVAALKDIQLQTPLRVYTRDGELIAQFGEKRRKPLALEEVPPLMRKAFLAAEDDRFFEHPGVDYHGLLRAAWHLLRTGEKEQGGSTITMQLARNFFLTSERTYERKLKEIFLALKMEQELSKRELLELYLNMIYLGNRAYGVGAAAEVYYGREVEGLSLSQIAMIAGLPKAPSRYNPIADPERARERRDYVLGRMRELSFINEPAYRTALAQPVTERLHDPNMAVDAPYIAEMVRAEMIARFGAQAYTGGYKVYTTVDIKLQRAAREALRQGLIAYDRRHGYRGPEGHIDARLLADQEAWDAALADYAPVGGLRPALVVNVKENQATVYLRGDEQIVLDWESLSWARPYISANSRGAQPQAAADVLEPGDIVRVAQDDKGAWRLSQVPEITGALVSLDPNDGSIVALVGGFDFQQSNFNRAVQAQRQPGSAFKPFIYSAALENGFTPASIINDAPVVFDSPGLESVWRPENYSGTFYGPTRMRVALAQSRNMVSIRLLSSIGLRAAVEHIQKFGFDAQRLPLDLSLALGSGSVSPLELASGYAVFANGGFRITPYLIERIEQANGEVIFEAQPDLACGEPCPWTNVDAPARARAATLLTEEEIAPAPRHDAHNGVGERKVAEEIGGPLPKRAPRAVSAANAYQMVSMMKDVIRSGTATKALVLERSDLAGKTGTTNELNDAWFSGYTPELVTTVWVGFDVPRSLGEGEVGGVAALPIWIDYMRVALTGVPERGIPQPEGMITVRIDPDTGLLASADSEDGIFETFRADQVPKRGAPESQRVSSDRPYQPQPVEIPEQLF
jgi:penicillin-binding protein 1A